MDWAAGVRWRKAMLISFLLHSLVLTGVGWLAGKVLLPVEAPETLIELELASEPEGPPLAAASEATPVNPSPVPNLPQPTSVQQVPVAEPGVEVPVVAVSAMAIVAVDSGAIASAGEPAGGGHGTGTSAGGDASQGGQGSGGGTGKSREVIPPGILSRREPNYPEEARQAGIEGTVVLKIEILENGNAGQVNIFKSSGSELLDDAAAAAVQRWRFIPAKVRETGRSIVCQTTMPVVFKLRS